MFEHYKDIFNQRGASYHKAMIDYPLARQEEFDRIINLTDIADGNIIADVPSGGSYLSNFIHQNVKIISIETSAEFSRFALPSERNVPLVCKELNEISLISDSLDRIISLAGLHHVNNRPSFYRESYRLLRDEGILSIADVKVGSNVAGFLNIFVDRYSSMGHQGDFLDENDKKALDSVGFNVVHAAAIAYTWKFNSVKEMVNCCQLMFGIDRANESQILSGIEEYLGYKLLDNKCYMNWELYFLKALKQQKYS